MRISNSIFLYSRNELPPEIQETPQPMASWRIMLLLAENYVAWDAHWAQTFASTDWVIWSRTLSCHDYQVTTVCLTCAFHASHTTCSFGENFLLLYLYFSNRKANVRRNLHVSRFCRTSESIWNKYSTTKMYPLFILCDEHRCPQGTFKMRIKKIPTQMTG